MSAFNSSYNLAAYGRDIPINAVPEISGVENISGFADPSAAISLTAIGETAITAGGAAAAIAFITRAASETIAAEATLAAGVYINVEGLIWISAAAETGATVNLEINISGYMSGTADTGADCRIYLDSFEMVTSGALIDIQEGSDEP